MASALAYSAAIARACATASLAPEAGGALAGDGRREVLELARVRVRRSTSIRSTRAGAAQLDHRGARMPRVVEPEDAVGACHFELVASRQIEAAVDRREHVAGEAQQPGEAHVDAVAAPNLLRVHRERLAREQPGGAHAVAADVHQRAALERRLQAHVAGPLEQERERRPDQAQLADLAPAARRAAAPAGGGAT